MSVREIVAPLRLQHQVLLAISSMFFNRKAKRLVSGALPASNAPCRLDRPMCRYLSGATVGKTSQPARGHLTLNDRNFFANDFGRRWTGP
ncbi:MAG: hypothetical protein ACTXOO_02670 [Sodalis sp. (in: enterobacteria)]